MKLGSLFSGQEGFGLAGMLADISLESEVWKPVTIKPYTEVYFVSNLGRVYSIRSKKVLKPTLTHDGYRRVSLSVAGQYRKVKVARLVALGLLLQTRLISPQ